MRILAIHHEDWKLYLRRAASRQKHKNLGTLESAIREAGIGWDYHEAAIEQSLRVDLERYTHLHALNRGVLLTPFHNMALMSPATTEDDVDRHTEVFREAVLELAA